MLACVRVSALGCVCELATEQRRARDRAPARVRKLAYEQACVRVRACARVRKLAHEQACVGVRARPRLHELVYSLVTLNTSNKSVRHSSTQWLLRKAVFLLRETGRLYGELEAL